MNRLQFLGTTILGFFNPTQKKQADEPTMKRINDTLYDIIDTHTGENFNYTKVTTYADGSAMNDAKCDGVIYRKLGSEYFKRNFTGAVNVRWFGAKGDYNVSSNVGNDDTAAIQKAISTGFNVDIDEGNYKISSKLIITKSGQTISGSSDRTCVLIATGNGLFQIGDSLFENIIEHVTLQNFQYFATESFTGKELIITKLCFQTYFKRLKYKYSRKSPTECIIALDNKGGTIEAPVRVELIDCYADGDNYSPSAPDPLVASPLFLWNRSGIQVIISNTHIQDFTCGAKCGVDPVLDVDYYDADYPNEGDFYDFYFINNSRFQIGNRGGVGNDGRAFEFWKGGNIVIQNSQIYLNNNAPDPELSGQRIAVFKDVLTSCVYSNNTSNFNQRAFHAFEASAGANVAKLMLFGNSFLDTYPFKDLIKINDGASLVAVISNDNYFSNPNSNGNVRQLINPSKIDLSISKNIMLRFDDGNSHALTEIIRGSESVDYSIYVQLLNGSTASLSCVNGFDNNNVFSKTGGGVKPLTNNTFFNVKPFFFQSTMIYRVDL